MSVHSQITRRHYHHLEKQERDQNPDGRFQHELASNGRLRFAILKNNAIDAISQLVARQLPRQVILQAAIHLWAVATTGPYANEDHEITIQRMNLYIAGQDTTSARVEKYEMDENGEWVEYRDTYLDASGNEVQEE